MIDLIAIEYPDRKELSLAIVNENCADKLCGPVPYKNGISNLAPMLVEHMPHEFTLEKAEQYLMVLHFRHMTEGKNMSGKSYPWVCK